ncbi:hypothetical protein NLI96_g5179 [Meripilus lineatus]|uniref:Uncharacterized protein n=1 Tax=Meripilus lineatus TaxID=2056292 RepID=A0AAD5YE44_9APHY|nr:hypothetical protein NLI96_g5179 [Physisporinus lineatus]
MILARCFVSSQDASALVDVALHALSLPIGEGSEIRFLVFDTLLGIMTNCSIMQAVEQRDRCMVLLQELACNEPIPTHKRFFDEQLRTVDFVQASPYNFIHEGVDGFTILEVDPSH